MLRLFVAVLLPADVRQRLCGLMGGVNAARWTDPADLHLTLRFIGETDEGRAADIDAALTQVDVTPFDLTLDGVGVFGSLRQPRVLWAGVGESDALTVLQGRVEAAVQRAGVAADARNFAPHVTLARLGRDSGGPRLGQFLADRNLFRAGPFPVQGFSLMRSHAGRQGPRYQPLRHYGNEAPATLWTAETEND